MGKGFRHGSGGALMKIPELNSAYPQNVSVNVGDNATFNVAIAKDGSPAKYTYQWYYDSKIVSGATGATYNRVAEAGTHSIYCIVTNKAGMVASRTATLTANTQYLINVSPVVPWQCRAWRYSNVSYSGAAPTVTQQSGGVQVALSGNYTGAYELAQDVDLTDVKTVTATIENRDSSVSMYLAVGKRSNSYTNQSAALVRVENGTISLDVTSLSGYYDVYFFFASSGSFVAKEVKLNY